MRKIFIVLLGVLLLQINAFAKDKLQFDFPNDGWHSVASPDGVQSKKCFVPYNQTADNYTEMLIFAEKVLKNKDISAMAVLQRQLGKDRNNFIDISPQYISKDFDDAMVTWCSKFKNTCVVERAFKGNQGVIIAIYINKAPHYSQNMFGQWSNILEKVKVYDGIFRSPNVIELD